MLFYKYCEISPIFWSEEELEKIVISDLNEAEKVDLFFLASFRVKEFKNIICKVKNCTWKMRFVEKANGQIVFSKSRNTTCSHSIKAHEDGLIHELYLGEIGCILGNKVYESRSCREHYVEPLEK